MKLKTKKFLIAGILFIIAIIAALIFLRFFPLDKIWKIASPGHKVVSSNVPLLSPAPNALFFDFETEAKTGSTSGLYHGIAHSGQYSVKAFGKNSYSKAIERTVAEIGTGNLAAVSMSAWVYILPGRNEPNGSFVFSANNSMGANICWKGIHVSGNMAPKGKWFKISGYFDLTDIKFSPDSRILIYFWNDSNTDILIDDYYIVFGTQPARKGDSSLVDMTRGVPFIPRFNYPPFPFLFLDKEEITGNQSIYLYRDKEKSLGELSPYDRIFKGHFFTGKEFPDDIIVVDKTGHPYAYFYCTTSGCFRKAVLTTPAGFTGFTDKDMILSGAYIPGLETQLLVVSENGMQLVTFNKIKEPCSVSQAETEMKILWSGAQPVLFQDGSKAAFYCSADVTGDNTDEILEVSQNGSFMVLAFGKGYAGSIDLRSSPGASPVESWNRELNEINVTPGKFLPAISKDILLTVFRSKKTGICGYTLLRYDPAAKNLVSCFSGGQKSAGKLIGPDTLKPGDEFFSGRFGAGGTRKIFRYNRDWRYDLKEIRFNDTAFQTLYNIDFRGFEKDHNPKYFEILKIVPGNYFAPGKTSFMIIGRNCKTRDQSGKTCIEFEERNILPNALEFYSYPEKQ